MATELSSEAKALILGQILKVSGKTFTNIGFRPGIATTMVILEALNQSDPKVMNDVLLKLTRFSVSLLRELNKPYLATALDPDLDEQQ